jgi:hypothetical protein
MIIDQDLTDAFNNKPRASINKIKTMSPSQLDSVKVYGSAAENLLNNKDFALFVHHYKFEMCDRLTDVKGHTEEDNTKRIAIAHNIAGIDEFVKTLQQAVFYKNQAVSKQAPTD